MVLEVAMRIEYCMKWALLLMKHQNTCQRKKSGVRRAKIFNSQQSIFRYNCHSPVFTSHSKLRLPAFVFQLSIFNQLPGGIVAT